MGFWSKLLGGNKKAEQTEQTQESSAVNDAVNEQEKVENSAEVSQESEETPSSENE